MVEIVGLIACVIFCIGVPLQVKAIRDGTAFRKAPEKRDMIVAATLKQFSLLSWLGIGFGVIEIALAFVEDEPGEWMFKLIAGIVWLAASALSFWGKRQIATLPSAAA
ncbi:MAG: hypothetical protein ACREHE_11830 [Rhizomicrobium sp.]